MACETPSSTFWIAPRLIEKPSTESQKLWMMERLSACVPAISAMRAVKRGANPVRCSLGISPLFIFPQDEQCPLQRTYLGYKQIIGEHLKYMALIEDRPVACIGWGSAALSVKSRESFIGWNKTAKDRNISLLVNNIRFLILPWVNIKSLASKIVSLNIKRIASDWMAVYRHPIYLLETFVERNPYLGNL